MSGLPFDKLKPFLKDFIQYYYNELGNGTGGTLHIALDDGNVSENDIWFCQEYAQKNNDHFGYFIATLMRYFTEDELEEMYDNGWWGMSK